MSSEHERVIFKARADVHRAAMYLAEMGLSVETIRAAMLDMAASATERAIIHALRFDTEQEERAVARDREDVADEMEARREQESA